MPLAKGSARTRLGPIIVRLLGLLVFVFNIITIIMSTGSLNIVIVGEGILGGLVYIVISLIVLYDISQKTRSGRIIICNILLLIFSFSLSIVSGCQAAMIQTSLSRLVKADQEIIRVIIQLGVLCAKVVANLMVFFISVSHLVVCTKLFMDMATQDFSEMQKMKIHPAVMSGQSRRIEQGLEFNGILEFRFPPNSRALRKSSDWLLCIFAFP